MKEINPKLKKSFAIGHCCNCSNWEKIKDSEYSQDFGECKLLSGSINPEIYPDSEKTGIEAYPICSHDGDAITYNTKSWFGCVGFKPISK